MPRKYLNDRSSSSFLLSLRNFHFWAIFSPDCSLCSPAAPAFLVCIYVYIIFSTKRRRSTSSPRHPPQFYSSYLPSILRDSIACRLLLPVCVRFSVLLICSADTYYNYWLFYYININRSLSLFVIHNNNNTTTRGYSVTTWSYIVNLADVICCSGGQHSAGV